MFGNNPDKDWEKFGREQPYFGVINQDAFRNENLGKESLANFFATGEEYIQWMWREIATHLDPEFKPRVGLDFGCGVGRLAIPLASRCQQVIGLDISPSMLEEAKKNCVRMDVGNVEFFTNTQALGPNRNCDFINSFIVFQHIIPKKGVEIFKDLLGRLNPGGIGAIHLTYQSEQRPLSNIVGAIRKRSNLANMLFNVIKGLPAGAPWMQMNNYNLNTITSEIKKAGCESYHAILTNHGGFLGVIFLFQKPKAFVRD